MTTGFIILILALVLPTVGYGFYLWFQARKQAVMDKNEQVVQDATAELLKKVRRIEIKTKGLSKQLFSGDYQTAFKGRGMSFSEVRDYHFGDDVRNIDWNVTARTGAPHVKIFEEEREMTVMMLIDMSRSSFFGTQNGMKNEILTEISAVLAFSAINNNDKVGVIFFTDKIEKFIPPKKGKSHILLIIRELLGFKPEGNGTDIGMALRYFNNVVKKRSICFLMSDFIASDFDVPLRIAANKHDLIGIHLFDPLEKKVPNVGLIKIKDPESGIIQWFDTSIKANRDKYILHSEQSALDTKNQFKKSGADFVSLSTNDSYVNVLIDLFKRRSH